jgi:molybdopterin-guanine dinucleotide biosynthesis protein A
VIEETAGDTADRVTAVILAGGRARRMGGQDKGLVALNGRPMVEYVLRALRPLVRRVLINANRNLDDYRGLGVGVVADAMADFQGPLAGMASAMPEADSPYLATTPCDSPFLPEDYVARMLAALERDDAEIAVAHDGERMQPVFTLMQTRLESSLIESLRGGERKIDRWFGRHRFALADFSDSPDTFININTPEERHVVEHRLGSI